MNRVSFYKLQNHFPSLHEPAINRIRSQSSLPSFHTPENDKSHGLTCLRNLGGPFHNFVNFLLFLFKCLILNLNVFRLRLINLGLQLIQSDPLVHPCVILHSIEIADTLVQGAQLFEQGHTTVIGAAKEDVYDLGMILLSSDHLFELLRCYF